MVRLCGSLGIRFGELLEQCVLPEYKLYSAALDSEMRKDYPPSLPQSDEAREACSDLVFGFCVSLVHIFRTANLDKTVGRMSFPGEYMAIHFGKIVESLKVHPPTLKSRTEFFEKLQRAPLATLLRFYRFPTSEQIEKHAGWLAASKMRNNGYATPWFPGNFWDILDFTEETDLFYCAPPEKKLVDNVAVSDNIASVNCEMPGLPQQLKDATEIRGKKTALAGFLRVPLSSVSLWLSGEREPGGEATLKMIRWLQLENSENQNRRRIPARSKHHRQKARVR